MRRPIAIAGKHHRRLPLLDVAIALAATFIAFEQALALTREQALEQCRETIGMPIVQACMRSHGSGGRSFAEQEACVAQARPQVHACVQKALNASGRAQVPVAKQEKKYVKKPASDQGDVSGIVDSSLQTTPPVPVRIALLVGNRAYDASVGALKNPYNDVAIVGASLRAQGFEVLPPIRDGSRSAVFQGVRELVRRLNAAAAGSIGFFYYSGHGAADKDTNINYLIPVDAREPGAPAFWDDSIKLDDVFALLNSARDSAKFVVFDACRNELRLPTKDTTKALLPVAEQQGLFIAFASAPGETASDQGENSGPYAAALATELMKPGLDHLNLFQNVKESVLASTGGVQHPWESNGLSRRVYLVRQAKIEVMNSARLSEPAKAWDKVKDTRDLAQLEAFAARYKETFYADLARARIKVLRK